MMNEFFAAVTVQPKIEWDDTLRLYTEREVEQKDEDPKKKGKKDADTPEVPETPPEEIKHFFEFDVLQDKAFSDDPELFKTMDQIKASLPEVHQFYQCKASLQLYRIDDIIFTLFPALQSYKRRAANTREIFLTNDPFTKDPRFTMTDTKKLQEQSAMHITASVHGESVASEEESRKYQQLFDECRPRGVSGAHYRRRHEVARPGVDNSWGEWPHDDQECRSVE